MGERTAHSEDTKAAAVAALLVGEKPSAVARQFGIPVGTVNAWKSAATHPNPVAVTLASQKKGIGELLMAYLVENLETLRAQAEQFRDPVWLSKQTANDAAILHGVMADKTIRLLESLGGPQPVAP